MTILHAHSDPDFTQHLRAVLSEANGAPPAPTPYPLKWFNPTGDRV